MKGNTTDGINVLMEAANKPATEVRIGHLWGCGLYHDMTWLPALTKLVTTLNAEHGPESHWLEYR